MVPRALERAGYKFSKPTIDAALAAL
ncbi:MAG: DUF1731 domain-containing protein [Kofleriaceae bacterium]|nr:DUF1731 domain-containing protein [Kofleriaceae bacterium]